MWGGGKYFVICFRKFGLIGHRSCKRTVKEKPPLFLKLYVLLDASKKASGLKSLIFERELFLINCFNSEGAVSHKFYTVIGSPLLVSKISYANNYFEL